MNDIYKTGAVGEELLIKKKKTNDSWSTQKYITVEKYSNNDEYSDLMNPNTQSTMRIKRKERARERLKTARFRTQTDSQL